MKNWADDWSNRAEIAFHNSSMGPRLCVQIISSIVIRLEVLFAVKNPTNQSDKVLIVCQIIGRFLSQKFNRTVTAHSHQGRVPSHWRIYIQNFPAHAPPTGPNSFVFTYISPKSTHVRGPHPPKTGPCLLREILDLPLPL